MKIFLQKQALKKKSKWSTGVVMVDINADGWLDIYVCNAGYRKTGNCARKNFIINNHDLTFTEKLLQNMVSPMKAVIHTCRIF